MTDPQIPLPQLDSILKEKIEKQLSARINLYKDQATIGSINLLNTYRKVNCVTLSDSGAVMATGLSDSTIKVFILSKRQHDILTIDDLIREQVEENLKAAENDEFEEKKNNQSKKRKTDKETMDLRVPKDSEFAAPNQSD